ncbi:cytochrome P450 [Cubamyces menziesii]|nr:cytochrome P450 [Cubamyces menziesii]
MARFFLAPLQALYVALLSIVALHYWKSASDLWRRRRGLSLPPGPRRWPLVGNLFNAPSPWKPWLGYRKLSSEFGDVVYLEMLGRPMVILGSPEVMIEFLERRSAVTSDRPESALMAMYVPYSDFKGFGQKNNFGFMRYGLLWRRLRRNFWQHFHSNAMPSSHPMQEFFTCKALARFLDLSADTKAVIRYAFGGTILKFVYGVEVENEGDPRIAELEEANDVIRAITTPMQFAPEALPFVGYLPTWTPFLGKLITRLSKSRAAHEHITTEQYYLAKARAEAGEDDTSMVFKLLAAASKLQAPQEEDYCLPVAAIAAEAGADTMSSTAEGLFLAMSLYPEVQEKARAELSTVVGPDRMPGLKDRKSLVYVNAIVKEALRWHNVTPIGVLHTTTADEVLRGHFIPSGTMIAPNIWACMHNPDIYPEPDTFNPERFIRDGKLRNDILDPMSIVFGFGRRKCPGRHFADAMLYIIVASLLHVFDVRPPLDEDGSPIKIELQQSHGFLSFPEDCRCVVRPQSARTEALLRNAVANDV